MDGAAYELRQQQGRYSGKRNDTFKKLWIISMAFLHAFEKDKTLVFRLFS